MNSTNRTDEFESLDLDSATLEQHFGAISSGLRDVTGKRYLEFTANTDVAPLIPILVGKDCEHAHTARRGRTPVAPLLDLRKELCAWIGIAGQWDLLEGRSKRRKRKFRFVSLALSIYFGARDDVNKLLMFRAEWSGSKPTLGGGYTFAPPTAGQPHWHFDALTSLVSNARDTTDVSLPGALMQSADFFDSARTSSIELFLKPSIDRIHFASGAAWWKSESAHLYTPANRQELESWAQRCATYMKNELCSLRRAGFKGP